METRASWLMQIAVVTCVWPLVMSFSPPGEDVDKPSGEPRKAEPGMSKASAIEVCAPAGERAYLNRLRCSDGSTVRYERSGSVGYRNEPGEEDKEDVDAQMTPGPIPPGQKDFHIIDRYETKCGGKPVNLYLDMYHCPEPKRHEVPPGFTLTGGDASR